MKQRSSEDPQGKEAVVLLGHGSRVPTAGQAMERVAARLREAGNVRARGGVPHVDAGTHSGGCAGNMCEGRGVEGRGRPVFPPRGRISGRIFRGCCGKRLRNIRT